MEQGRIILDEVYVDDIDDVFLLERKLMLLLAKIKASKERVAVVILDEEVHKIKGGVQ